MIKFIALLISLLALAGCATDATVRASPEEVSGSYYSGDGLGRNVTVVLRPDGTFQSDWQGCLGVYGEAEGTWQVQGDQILFNPVSEQEMLKGYLRRATTIRHSGQLGFALAQDVERERIDEQFVFVKPAPEQ